MSSKSILAVIAGIIFIVLVTTIVDIVLHLAGVYPPLGQPLADGPAILATAYRTLIGVAGGYLTARLAPERPLTHAIVLGCIGIVLGLAGVVATWNSGLGPRWYPIALTVLALPQCWLGGRISESASASRRAAAPPSAPSGAATSARVPPR